MLGKALGAMTACAAVAITLCACNNAVPTSNPTAIGSAPVSPASTESPAEDTDTPCAQIQLEIDTIQQAVQGPLGGDSWVLRQRLVAAVQSAPDEIKLAASQVATVLKGVLDHPDEVKAKVTDPVVVHDVELLQQWHAQHC
jgi:hypothetical protein